MALQKITPFLWFDSQAEDAAQYYTSIFKDSKIGRISHYGKEGFENHHQPEGSIMVVEFEIEGQKFSAINAGPIFKFNEAISFVVNCDTQEEIDYYWYKLIVGGDPKAQQCGWLKDKFGLSWQITPTQMAKWWTDPDQKKKDRLMKAMMPMKKMDIDVLRKAFEGKE